MLLAAWVLSPVVLGGLAVAGALLIAHGGHARWSARRRVRTLGLAADGRAAPVVAQLTPTSPDGQVLQRHGAATVRAGDVVRERARLIGGGAFLGVCRGRWALADREQAVLVLGPPRSGKTSAVVIPTMLCAPGAAVCTSTKLDVLRATMRSRSEIGQVWLFDPAGAQQQWPEGARRLCWSPVVAARTWDGALLTARAMAAASGAGKGTSNELHWRERASALLAPLLHAAALTDRPIADVLRWVLRQDLDPAGKTLENQGAEVPNDVLLGIARTDQRERSSIFSATAGVLSAYNADATRKSAAQPNFDPARFVDSTDTLYITAPAHKQDITAPLIVGLLEQIRYAAYERHARREASSHAGDAPVLWCLDELANIAPIHDLPALVSEAGGQGLHVLACLQDLSQARARWGQDADGFLSLFQTKLMLNGIADTRTLEAISLILGEYDRHLVSHTLGRSTTRQPLELLAPHTDSESVSYNTQRQRTLTPGDIHRLPHGHALLLHSSQWGLTRLTPAHRCEPWAGLAG
jgi:type IV secretion system protein VirD4